MIFVKCSKCYYQTDKSKDKYEKIPKYRKDNYQKYKYGDRNSNGCSFSFAMYVYVVSHGSMEILIVFFY